MSIFSRIRPNWVSVSALALCALAVRLSAEIATPVLRFTSGTDLNEWLVTGPFDGESDASMIDEDLLRPLGMAESENLQIVALQSKLNSGSTVTQKVIKVQDGVVDLQHAFGRSQKDMSKIKQSGAYLDCMIESEAEQPAYLSIGNADALKLWVNGDLVYRFEGRSVVETYGDCIRIKLKAGPNLLRAKALNIDEGRGIAVHLEKQPSAAARVAMKSMRIRPGNLLTKVFVDSRNPLVMSLRGVPQEFACGAMVLDVNETTLLRLTPEQLRSPGWVPTLPEGVYIFRVVVGGEKYDEPFCVGESQKVFAQLKTEATPFLDQTPRGLSLAGYIRRLEILHDPKVKPARFSYTWDRRILFPLAAIARTIRQSSGQDNLGRIGGLQIRGFKSKIDDQIQFYRLYIPESAGVENTKLPLVIFVPTTVSANRPFIQSPFIVAQSEAERMAALAEKYRMAILWCGYRNQPRGLPSELTHLDEVLDDVGNIYPIDSDRMFLCGACSGGAVSSFYALDRPGRYAGIGMLNPVFGLHSPPGETWDFRKFETFSEYESSWDMAPTLLEKTKIPILLINDGAEPGHGDLFISEYFAKLAAQNRYPLEFEIRAKPRAQHFDAWERFLAWFSAAERKSTSSDRPSLWRQDTVAASLARRFVVVEGTGGNDHDRQILQDLSKQFQDAWKETYHGPCRVVRDTDFDIAGDAESTLILIGNEKINLVWKRLKPKLPIRLGTKTVHLSGREWSGDGLSVIATMKNPLAKNGDIIFLGAADPTDINFGALDLTTEGWFSFAIFGRAAEGPKLIDAGLWPKVGR